jgi:hypothetical protein
MKHAIDILTERLAELTRLTRHYRDDCEWANYMGDKAFEAWQAESHQLVAALKRLNGPSPLVEMVQERIERDGSTNKTPYGNPYFAEIRKLADEVAVREAVSA